MKAWEDMCFHCGLCCREKVIKDDFLIFLSSKCQYLSSEDECTCYYERFKKNKRCLKVNIFRACFSLYLPSSCAYVLWAKKHHIRFRRTLESIIEDDLTIS